MWWAVLALGLVLMGQPVAYGQQSEGQIPEPAQQGQDQSLLANVLTGINIPARGVVCGLTGVLAGVFMMASGGMRYGDAAQMLRGGCSGPWIITPQMIDGSGTQPTPD
ncbi:MAG: hypothetical protein A2038_08040 [Deltaproteobacteria bacterium GWA2_57_13]|nr:MAG: hypothetical protein A2038_08040 [Deltaproteobacteria bacterium GWA2_57_13]OGQ75850.1 MAG: hypothetical protein A3G40_09990 [Deltaproteobacteria bacterium RIFCSPLOWO2_12_FULL_57_22]